MQIIDLVRRKASLLVAPACRLYSVVQHKVSHHTTSTGNRKCGHAKRTRALERWIPWWTGQPTVCPQVKRLLLRGWSLRSHHALGHVTDVRGKVIQRVEKINSNTQLKSSCVCSKRRVTHSDTMPDDRCWRWSHHESCTRIGTWARAPWCE